LSSHTLAEKLIAAHCVDAEEELDLWPGDLVEVNVDVVLANDITAPISLREFDKLQVDSVFDPDKVVLVADHFAPNKDIKSAEQCLVMRKFAQRQELPHHYDVGRMGIEHVLLPEKGLVLPGDMVVGADSHTCTYGALGAFATGMGSTDIAVAMATGRIWMRVPETMKFIYTGKMQRWVSGKDLILYTIGQIGVSGALYKAMEFAGPIIDELPMSGRFTMANMAIEAGGKAGLFTPDEKTLNYVDKRANRPYKVVKPDADASYETVIEIDVSHLQPQVSFPHLPENAHPVSDARHIRVDQSIIGSCTNGRLDDLRAAANILKGHKVHRDVRCIILPGTQQVYMDALKEGLIEVFIEAGAAVSTPTCGPCLGGYMGILAAGERSISTTNRNFRGRMGHPDSEVYLSNPSVAAATAITGYIADPREVL
jgi:3-isopropylmalate/(R)-2-methylmalate dehydratase large subunit